MKLSPSPNFPSSGSRSQGKIADPITSYAGPLCDYRIVNFVEVGVGTSRPDKLTEFLTVYDGRLVRWGIHYWYMKFFKATELGRFAIIDKVRVINLHDEEKGGREIDPLQPSSLQQAAWIEAIAKHGIVEVPTGRDAPEAAPHAS
jgi:hypothetical protein